MWEMQRVPLGCLDEYSRGLKAPRPAAWLRGCSFEARLRTRACRHLTNRWPLAIYPHVKGARLDESNITTTLSVNINSTPPPSVLSV